MTEYTIPLCVPEISGNEMDYADRAIRRGEIAIGDYIPRFEQAVAEYVGAAHAVAVSSGTAALHLALLAAGVGPDDEVIVPALSFIATANAVRYCGADLVFVDVEWEHGTMDIDLAQESMTQKTVCFLPVHLLGHPVSRLGGGRSIGHYYDLYVVEDATEALGATYKSKRVGTLGDLACLSFNGNKLLTTGGGGMVLTDDADLAGRVRYLANQAKDDPTEYVHKEVGYNYRLSNIQAAIGCAQMERIDEFLAAKRRIAETYSRELAGVPGLILPTEAPWARSAWWLFTMRVDPAGYGMDARALRESLAGEGVESRCLWQPLHLSPAYASYYRGSLPVAERIWREALSLPSSVGLTEAQQARVVEAVRRGVRRGG